jgi:molybdenum cofactor cytidylyltransferase
MIFSTFALNEAEGALLAHSHRVPGRMLKKGTLLDATAIAALREAGITQVIAAKLDPGDLLENPSADRLATLLTAPLLHRTQAATGRVNLVAEAAGLLRVEAAAIDRINTVDEALTVATLPDYAVVAPGDMVATIKVIPFAVAAEVQTRVENAAQSGAFTLHPFTHRRVGLVVSEFGTMKQSVYAGTVAATQGRVAGLGGTLLPALRCPHEETAIAAALDQLRQAGAEILLVAGASATVDRRDVGPAAIVRCGGEIRHFGMPVDPGNLICIGRIDDIPALVLPGCARSPKLNGIDWVLQRLFAGLDVGPAEIMRMGVGGLLKDTEARPLPRARATATPRVAAIVLAAGRSSRMAPRHKLLIPGADGRAMVARVVDNILASAARPVLVVTGHRADEVRAALAGRDVRFVHADRHADGLAESLKSGLAALPDAASAALICLGDMPLVQGPALDRLIAAYDPDEGRTIVVPVHDGQQGNPVLWDRSYIEEMQTLTGDTGARSLLRRHVENIAEVAMGDDAVLRDFDTVESLASLPPRLRPELA